MCDILHVEEPVTKSLREYILWNHKEICYIKNSLALPHINCKSNDVNQVIDYGWKIFIIIVWNEHEIFPVISLLAIISVIYSQLLYYAKINEMQAPLKLQKKSTLTEKKRFFSAGNIIFMKESF